MKAAVPISYSRVSHFAHQYVVFSSKNWAMNRVLSYTTYFKQSHPQISQLQAFQRHQSQYRIVVYSCLRCDIMFDGQVATPQAINMRYEDRHYHVITNLMGEMAKGYMCPACNKGCSRGAEHRYDASCDTCSSNPCASRITLGSLATSATGNLGTRRVSKITSV